MEEQLSGIDRVRSSSSLSLQAVDTKQASALLGLHPDSLRKFRRHGGGPPYARVGRAIRYRIADLEAWLRQRTFTSQADELARGEEEGVE
jgi:Helix-turn-helix domain